MKFSVCLTTVALFVAAGCLLTSDSASFGTAVSDNVAAELHGGCAGIGIGNGCTLCSSNVYTNGSDRDYDPGSITGYYCTTTVNGKTVCKTCSSTRVSCGTSVGVGAPIP